MEINVDFYHTSFRDMDIELESPSGAVSKLTVPYNTRHLTEVVDGEPQTLYTSGWTARSGSAPPATWAKTPTANGSCGSPTRSPAWAEPSIHGAIKVYGHSGTPTTSGGDAHSNADCNADAHCHGAV